MLCFHFKITEQFDSGLAIQCRIGKELRFRAVVCANVVIGQNLTWSVVLLNQGTVINVLLLGDNCHAS